MVPALWLAAAAALRGSGSGVYTEHPGLNCCRGRGGVNIDSGPAPLPLRTVTECAAFCDATPACHCFVITSNATKANGGAGGCWRRSACDAERCGRQAAFDTYIKPGGAPVPPGPPIPPHQPLPYPDRSPLGPACKGCPNIILSITDDQDLVLGGWEPMRQTQKLVADRGATFTQWRIHTPICSPSRSELVSGRYYHNIKSTLAVPVPNRIIYAGTEHVNGTLYKNQSFGVFLRRSKGYQVGLFGKGNFNTYDGFDRWFQGVSFSYGPVKWQDDESPGGVYTQGPDVYPTSLLGNKTVEWISRKSVSGEGRPFFAYFASHCPHFPATPAHEYEDACPGFTAKKYPNFNHTNALYHELIASQPPLTAVDAALVDELARSRCQCLLSVDDSHAGILAAVDRLGLSNNTYFFFTSDHGYNLGGHRLTSEKMNMYEHTLKIPLVVVGPGIQSGVELGHLGTNVDLSPSFLELAGIETPACMDGRSVAGFLIPDPWRHDVPPATASLLRRQRRRRQRGGELLLSSDTRPWRTESFFQYYDAGPWAPPNGGDDCHICHAGQGTVRKFDDASNTYIGLYVQDASLGTLKYAEFQNVCTTEQLLQRTCFGNLTTRELFNLDQDPHELTNIASTADASLISELHKRLHKYYPCRGTSCP